LYWTQQALLPLSELPGLAAQGAAGVDNFVMPRGLGQIPAIWSDPALPICLSQEQEGGWSIGWRWHPSQTFDVTLVSVADQPGLATGEVGYPQCRGGLRQCAGQCRIAMAGQ
jgi:hypothetical protein